MFTIEDNWHCELKGNFPTFDLALAQIREWAKLPWNEEPNLAPCMSWPTCGRFYDIVESKYEGREFVRATPIVQIDSKGVRWEVGFGPE